MVIKGDCRPNSIRLSKFPPNAGGNQCPCRDAGVGAIAPGFAMLKRASALHTLIRHRHPTPSCGGHAPTAERTLNPARKFLESRDRRPGIREQPGSIATEIGSPRDVRFSPESDRIADIPDGQIRPRRGANDLVGRARRPAAYRSTRVSCPRLSAHLTTGRAHTCRDFEQI
jgi:hypothetical protein